MIVDVLIATCALAGAAFMAIAALGILRMGDLYTRLHCSTKAATLGVALVLIATAMASADVGVTTRCLLAAVFFIATAPVGGHVIARAAYHAGEALWHRTTGDELRRDLG